MRRLFFLALAVLLLPVVDWTLLWQVGSAWGGQAVLGVVLLGLVAGTPLCRRAVPLSPPWVAGALLAFPGPLSDVLGLLFLVPEVRSAVFIWILRGAGIRGHAQAGPGSTRAAADGDDSGPGESRWTGRQDGVSPPGSSEHIRDVDYRMVGEERTPNDRRE